MLWGPCGWNNTIQLIENGTKGETEEGRFIPDGGGTGRACQLDPDSWGVVF